MTLRRFGAHLDLRLWPHGSVDSLDWALWIACGIVKGVQLVVSGVKRVDPINRNDGAPVDEFLPNVLRVGHHVDTFEVVAEPESRIVAGEDVAVVVVVVSTVVRGDALSGVFECLQVHFICETGLLIGTGGGVLRLRCGACCCCC